MFMEAAGAIQGAGQIMSALGIGKKGASAKDARKMLTVQNKVFRENLAPNVQAFKDAGIHPLYGMNSMQFQPQPVSMSGDSPDLGDRLSLAGQGVQRAASAFTSKEERARNDMRETLQLENMHLQNKLLESQITSIGRPTTPAFPSSVTAPLSGQGDSTRLPGFSGGVIPDAALGATQRGRMALIPSPEMKQAIEDSFIPEMQWYLRQALAKPPDGSSYNPLTSEYRKPYDDLVADFFTLLSNPSMVKDHFTGRR